MPAEEQGSEPRTLTRAMSAGDSCRESSDKRKCRKRSGRSSEDAEYRGARNKSAIIPLPVPDFQDSNFPGFVVHLDDSIVPDPEPISLSALKLEAVRRMGISGQTFDGVYEAIIDCGGESGCGLASLLLDYDFIARRDA